MNPIKFLWTFVKEFIKDFVGDVIYLFVIIKKLLKQEKILDDHKVYLLKQEFKNMDYKEEVKSSIYWVWAILFALVIGFFIASQYYQIECNNFIIDNYVNNAEYRASQGIENFNLSDVVLDLGPETPFVSSEVNPNSE